MSVMKDLQISYIKSEINIPAWYEFVLKPELLKDHLESTNPEPSGPLLIKIFYDQINRTINKEVKGGLPLDNERNRTLKSLALQAAALMNWKIKLFESDLPLTSRHQLLTEFMKACKTCLPSNNILVTLQNLHDHALASLILYCRFAALTVIKATFQTKNSSKLICSLPQAFPHQAVATQTDKDILSVKEQVASVVQCLENVLLTKRSLYLPGAQTIAENLLCQTKDSPSDILVAYEEVHAQVRFDLGSIHFTHEYYNDAYEMFKKVKELQRSLPSPSSGFCDFDDNQLNGYILACESIVGRINGGPIASICSPEIASRKNLHQIVEEHINYSNDCKTSCRIILDCIEMNLYKKELSGSYVDMVDEALQSRGLDAEDMFNVKWLCALSRTVNNIQQPVHIWCDYMEKSKLDGIFELVKRLKGKLKFADKKKVENYLWSLFNNLIGDDDLHEYMIEHPVFIESVSKNKLLALQLKYSKRNKSMDVDEMTASEAPTTNESPGAKFVAVTRKILSTLDPQEIERTLKQARKLDPNGLILVSPYWRLSCCYELVFKSVKDLFFKDLLHICFAKIIHCTSDMDFENAKILLDHLKDRFHSSTANVQVCNCIKHETLKIELMEILKDDRINFAMDSSYHQIRIKLSQTIADCRGLLKTIHTEAQIMRLAPDLAELCVSLLINLEEFQFLKSGQIRSSKNHSARLVSTLANLHVALQLKDQNMDQHVRPFWNGLTTIFICNRPPQLARSRKIQSEATGRGMPPVSEISRNGFLKLIRLIKNPRVLQTIVSALVHLLRLCCSDDVHLPNATHLDTLWPAQLDADMKCSGIGVAYVLRETLSHCLQLNPGDKSWLKVQGDLNFAAGNPNTALKCYLLIGAYSTNFFTQIPNLKFYEDESIIERMIKCCEQLKCFTQAAVLCQFLKEADYGLAFKVLQENRKRSDAAEFHYSQHVWDVQILEHAIYFHKESGEVGKKKAAISAIARPELNHSNNPQVMERVQKLRATHFFQAMARQYLLS